MPFFYIYSFLCCSRKNVLTVGRIMICSLKITISGVVLRRKRIPLQQKTKSIYKI